jgi:phosphate starvation-inducible PhoH-like protein
MAGKGRGTRGSKKLSREEQEELEVLDINASMSKSTNSILANQIKFLEGTELKNDKQKKLVQKIKNNKIIFIKGPAGCGKTFVSLRAALDLLKTDEAISKIQLTKPIVEAGNENIGFLKGGLDEKIGPYMSSFYSNIEKLVGKVTSELLKARFYVSEKPIAYMRGDTFDNCICIIDEAQNLTKNGLKLVISRLGNNSKMIIMGDTDQIDVKLVKGEKTGLDDAFTRFEGVPGVAFHEFGDADIVRNSILIDIMKRYREDDQK